MKKIFISLVFWVILFTGKVSADILGYVHEYTVDLYYGNGVKADARNSSYHDWQIRTIKMKIAYPSLKQALKYGETKLAYNASYTKPVELELDNSSVGKSIFIYNSLSLKLLF